MTGQIGTVSSSLWPEHLQARYYAKDPEVMLAVECSNLGVERRPSTIQHEHAGMGLFVGRNFGKDEVIGFYYGSLCVILVCIYITSYT